MELHQMFPPVASFSLLIADKRVNIKLRKVTLSDHNWCNHTFNKDISDVLIDHCDNVDVLSRLIYRQVCNEDTKHFQKKEAIAYDELGEETSLTLGGPSLLARYIDNNEDAIAMIEAYRVCLESSMPIVEPSKKKVPTLLKRLRKLLGR